MGAMTSHPPNIPDQTSTNGEDALERSLSRVIRTKHELDDAFNTFKSLHANHISQDKKFVSFRDTLADIFEESLKQQEENHQSILNEQKLAFEMMMEKHGEAQEERSQQYEQVQEEALQKHKEDYLLLVGRQHTTHLTAMAEAKGGFEELQRDFCAILQTLQGLRERKPTAMEERLAQLEAIQKQHYNELVSALEAIKDVLLSMGKFIDAMTKQEDDD